MNKTLIIGSTSHEQADNIEWTQPFGDNLEKYDCIIIDLTSFPKNFPRTLFTNIGILKRTSRIFMRDYKEIFCIMEKPFNILFKEIPLNYSWVPFPQKLTVNPMLLGKTINRVQERFTDYFKNVEKWDNELFWQNTDNISFDSIAENKEQNSIAATVTMINRGKIHFLPKSAKTLHFKAIELLIRLASKKEKQQEQSWLNTIDAPENNCSTNGDYRNLFSADCEKITKAVYLILEELGITATTIFDVTYPKNSVQVHVITSKGPVESQNPQINNIASLIENQITQTKIMVVANTYNEQPIENRTNKEQIDSVTKLFFETNNVLFMTTLSLYNLWKRVVTNQISVHEASTLIQNQNGEIEI